MSGIRWRVRPSTRWTVSTGVYLIIGPISCCAGAARRLRETRPFRVLAGAFKIPPKTLRPDVSEHLNFDFAVVEISANGVTGLLSRHPVLAEIVREPTTQVEQPIDLPRREDPLH